MPGTETFQCDSFGCFSLSITPLNALAIPLEGFFNIFQATHTHAHTHARVKISFDSYRLPQGV